MCKFLLLGGPSPRGRGNRRDKGFSDYDVRAIPAWAGEPIEVSPDPIEPDIHQVRYEES